MLSIPAPSPFTIGFNDGTIKILETHEHNGNVIHVFTPLNPIVEGHLLVVPVTQVVDFMDDPELTASTCAVAAIVAKSRKFLHGCDFNLTTSAGAAATQTVFHLHIHLVPRYEGDGLTLPWTGQHD